MRVPPVSKLWRGLRECSLGGFVRKSPYQPGIWSLCKCTWKDHLCLMACFLMTSSTSATKCLHVITTSPQEWTSLWGKSCCFQEDHWCSWPIINHVQIHWCTLLSLPSPPLALIVFPSYLSVYKSEFLPDKHRWLDDYNNATSGISSLDSGLILAPIGYNFIYYFQLLFYPYYYNSSDL